MADSILYYSTHYRCRECAESNVRLLNKNPDLVHEMVFPMLISEAQAGGYYHVDTCEVLLVDQRGKQLELDDNAGILPTEGNCNCKHV